MYSGRQRRFANPNSNRKGEFLNSNRKDRFPNSIHDIRGGYSNPYEVRILSFNGSHNVESTLL